MKKICSIIIIMIIILGVAFSPRHQVEAATTVLYASPGGDAGGTTCPINDPCTLQRAVHWSNEDITGDAIIYIETGTYSDSYPGFSEVLILRDGVELIGGCDFSSGTARCSVLNGYSILDGQGDGRVIKISTSNSETVILRNLKIINGLGTEDPNTPNCNDYGNGDPVGCGGGILAFSGGTLTLSIVDCWFQANYAYFNTSAPVDYQGTGGAVHFQNSGPLTVMNSTFYGNTAVGDGSGYGGAILTQSDENRFSNNNFDSNHCSFADDVGEGCAIHINQSDYTEILDNKFNMNNSNIPLTGVQKKEGGAIYSSLTHELLVKRNNFTGNRGNSVLYDVMSENDIYDQVFQNKFWNNAAYSAITVRGHDLVSIFHNFIGFNEDFLTDEKTYNGISLEGYIYGYDMDAHVWHNTIANIDRGIRVEDEVNAEIANNIIAYTDTAVYAYSLDGAITGTTNIESMNGEAGALPATNLLHHFPYFVDVDNGDFHLQPNSGAIDAAANYGLSTDFDGQHRPFGAGPDIGADECYYQTFLPITIR